MADSVHSINYQPSTGMTWGNQWDVLKDDPAATTTFRGMNQMDRVDAGLNDGSLTAKEALDIHADLDAITTWQSKFMADGHLSRSEVQNLRDLQNIASENIKKARHNSDIADPDSEGSKAAIEVLTDNVDAQKAIYESLKQGSMSADDLTKASASLETLSATYDGQLDRLWSFVYPQGKIKDDTQT